jgi:CysZ protein
LPLFTPLSRAFSQFDDPVFIGTVWRSVAWSVACFAATFAGTIWLMHRLIDLHGPLRWLADAAGVFGSALLAFWLFLPVATTIGMMYFERIASAVEARFYPWMPPPEGEGLAQQMLDGLAVTMKVLWLNVAALVLTLLLWWAGIGFVLGWMVAAYAIGRGLFVAVAMRRMPRRMAEAVYLANRSSVLAQGAVLALMAYVPVINLLIPVIGTAAMVHLLDMAMSTVAENRPSLT